MRHRSGTPRLASGAGALALLGGVCASLWAFDSLSPFRTRRWSRRALFGSGQGGGRLDHVDGPGVAGSFAGAFLGRALGLHREGEPAGFAVLGAVILVILYHAVSGRR